MISSDSYLKVLNAEQKKAVMHEGHSLLILAGAGSGKTRVITTKIAWLIGEKGISPRSILAVTFTKKAANEMKERACLLNEDAQYSQIRTFHSFGSWFLRKYAESCGLTSSFSVYDDDDAVSLISKAMPELNRAECTAAAKKIALAKDFCYSPESKELGDISSNPLFQEIYARYEDMLQKIGNVDFGDLILKPLRILQQNEIIRKQIQDRFKVILVDEYQDSNVAQFELLRALAGPETYVCVVGDDDQSIYSFRGAEVKNILTFQQSFPGAELIKLERNYRSVAPILDAAEKVVVNNTGRLGKKLKSERGAGKRPQLFFLSNQDEEVSLCAEMIKEAHKKGCPYSDWAILYRTNAQSLGFETEFLNKKIPYSVVGSLKFYEREEIKDMLAFISLVLNPRDQINFERIINKPSRGVGAASQKKIVDEAVRNHDGDLLKASKNMLSSLSKKASIGVKCFVDILDELNDELGDFSEINGFDSSDEKELIEFEESKENLSSFIERISKLSGLLEYYTAKDEVSGVQRISNIQELANSAIFYPKSRKGLTMFLEHIELDRTLTEDNEESDSVTLITLHNTKGLEFSRVVITGIEKGVFPREDKTDEELEEERRLFYVGITRARDELYLTSCSCRRMYGRTEFMKPSPFLSELNLSEIDIKGRVPYEINQLLNDDESSKKKDNDDPLLKKWKPGTRIYHDDFGYGFLSKAEYSDGEFVVTVAFESGTIRRIMPEYQSGSLMIIGKD